MQTQTLELIPTAPGLRASLTVLRFGTPGRGPKAVIQASLHADEVPAMLVASRLRTLLADEEARGQLRGEVVLLPWANPLGLAQTLLGQHHGRFDLRDGVNFNRQVPELGPALVAALRDRLGSDAEANAALARATLREQCARLTATDPASDLKRQLLTLACDADIVLDLHCDAEAALHLYALTPQSDIAEELGALLGAQAILLATESGDGPFDEACSKPWLQLREALPAASVPLGCFATTVELRGEADTDHALATQDARALVAFLRRRGVLAGDAAPLPPARCRPTPLAASEPVVAPVAGVVVFRCAVGSRVEAGAAVADIVQVDSGDTVTVHAASAGVLYARISTRWAHAGQRIAKIAGTTLARTGKLLSA